MATIRIVQKISICHATKRQKNTIQALGLGKVNSSVETEGTPQILGMVNKVKHLVCIE
ncbi:MAG: 50S ribosomal protein L30 [Bacteroidota bacterium]|nr:50S ribosomal protein L30 [Bacteroidota bacterium]MDP4225167.1 50S ribosomal protein L30 [Bacteroidota bacterium]MDP4272805.1 50S ribosomal protein L30 [Bacteroidota bacterium]